MARGDDLYIMRHHDMHSPDDQGFIPGIHNYCDRRCERCLFMRQCRVGALEADDAEDGAEPASERPEDLRERLMKLMGITPEDMAAYEAHKAEQEEAKDDEADEGSAPEAFDASNDDDELDEYRREAAELDRRIDAHPLGRIADAHMERVHQWIEHRADALKARGVELHPRQGLDIAVGQRTAEMQSLSEAVQLILWDHTMLNAKVKRALHGLLDDGLVITEEDLQSDHNGTAKLCLELAHRSREAWDVVCDHLPEERSEAAPIMALLDDMLKELHHAFPRAGAFIRPGFDAPRSSR